MTTTSGTIARVPVAGNERLAPNLTPPAGSGPPRAGTAVSAPLVDTLPIEETPPTPHTDPQYWKLLERDVVKLADTWSRATPAKVRSNRNAYVLARCLAGATEAAEKIESDYAERVQSHPLMVIKGTLSKLRKEVQQFVARVSGTPLPQDQEALERDAAALTRKTLDAMSQAARAAASHPLAERSRLLPLIGEVFLRALAIGGLAVTALVALPTAAAVGAIAGCIAGPLIWCHDWLKEDIDDPVAHLFLVPGVNSVFFGLILVSLAWPFVKDAIQFQGASLRAAVQTRRGLVADLTALRRHLEDEIQKRFPEHAASLTVQEEPVQVRVTHAMADQDVFVIDIPHETGSGNAIAPSLRATSAPPGDQARSDTQRVAISHRYPQGPVTLDPRVTEAEDVFRQAGALGRYGRLEQALDTYDHLIEQFGAATEPSLRVWVAKAMNSKAIELRGLGQHDEAIGMCGQVIERYGKEIEPPLPGPLAGALLQKGFDLGKRNDNDQVSMKNAHDEVLTDFGAEPGSLQEQVTLALFNQGFFLGRLGRDRELADTCKEMDVFFGTEPEPPVAATEATLSPPAGHPVSSP